MADLKFAILGPVQVRVAGRPVRLGTPKQRMVLVALLTRANTPVTHEQLIEELWPRGAPPSALANLRSYINGLRQALPPEDRVRIESRPGGYSVTVSTEELDLLSFDRWAALGRAALERGDTAEAAAYLERAEGLWRGSLAEDVKHGPRLSLLASWLSERRQTFTEDLMEIRMLTEAAGALIPVLRAWVHDYPLRERGWQLLMLSLYQSGDRASAIRAYSEARRAFIIELGVEPGAVLQELHLMMLRSDSLDAAEAFALGRNALRVGITT